jgi:hypothetical protein
MYEQKLLHDIKAKIEELISGKRELIKPDDCKEGGDATDCCSCFLVSEYFFLDGRCVARGCKYSKFKQLIISKDEYSGTNDEVKAVAIIDEASNTIVAVVWNDMYKNIYGVDYKIESADNDPYVLSIVIEQLRKLITGEDKSNHKKILVIGGVSNPLLMEKLLGKELYDNACIGVDSYLALANMIAFKGEVFTETNSPYIKALCLTIKTEEEARKKLMSEGWRIGDGSGVLLDRHGKSLEDWFNIVYVHAENTYGNGQAMLEALNAVIGDLEDALNTAESDSIINYYYDVESYVDLAREIGADDTLWNEESEDYDEEKKNWYDSVGDEQEAMTKLKEGGWEIAFNKVAFCLSD